MRVMLEIRRIPQLHGFEAGGGGETEEKFVSSIPPFKQDQPFGRVPVDATSEPDFVGFDGSAGFSSGTSRYIVRGEVDRERLDELEDLARSSERIVGVYADLPIEPFARCFGEPSHGDVADVASRIGVSHLIARGMDGAKVAVAIIDTGINAAYLSQAGKPADVRASWGYKPGLKLTKMPVGHGTMCAYSALIAAPKATLLDMALLRPLHGNVIEQLTSDAVKAFRWLLRKITHENLFSSYNGLVVSNSWGIFNTDGDAPIGSPLNYASNPQHPLNVAVHDLAVAGADIVFAAGNCGNACTLPACGGKTSATIYGANGHPDVLTVGAVDLDDALLGYSSIGPGSLGTNKPDLAAYSHYRGSGVNPADEGTSTAAPLAAGVIAALRSKWKNQPTPNQLRASLRNYCRRTPSVLYPNYELGSGVLDAGLLLQHM